LFSHVTLLFAVVVAAEVNRCSYCRESHAHYGTWPAVHISFV